MPRAVAAAKAAALALGLAADEAIVLHASNRLAVRLLPADVLSRIAVASHGAAQLEVDLATRLRGADSPVAGLDPRVPPEVFARDGFAITFWTYYPTIAAPALAPADYAAALSRLHQRLQSIDLQVPRFTDRVAEAEQLVGNHDRTPNVTDTDRELVMDTLRAVTGSILQSGAREQLLHGEPHRGNILNTSRGAMIIDLETCCRGPIEFDVAHVPEAVSEQYPGIDRELLGQCRQLVLAMVAAWRMDPDDQFPHREQAGGELLAALRAGPPYATLDAVRAGS